MSDLFSTLNTTFDQEEPPLLPETWSDACGRSGQDREDHPPEPSCCKRCCRMLLGKSKQGDVNATYSGRRPRFTVKRTNTPNWEKGATTLAVIQMAERRKTAREHQTGKVTSIQRLRNHTGWARFEDLYELQDVLARGGFGTTYKAVERGSGRIVVVKKPDDVTDHEDFDTLKDKTHPHVVRVFDFFSDEIDGTHIVMEYCAGGDLYQGFWKLHEAAGSVSAPWCAGIFQQVIEGVVYLHNQFQQSHNDIKPENILLDHAPKDGNDVPRAMIADFGCVAMYGEGKGGDPRYCALEVLTGGQPSVRSDVWSLGVTLHELLTGELLFVDHYNISGWTAFSEFKEGKLLAKLSTAWEDMKSGKIKYAPCNKIKDKKARGFAQQFLQVDPAKRLNLQESLKHAWFEVADLPIEENTLDAAICMAHANRAKNFKLRSVLLAFVVSKLQGEHIDYYKRIWDKFDKNHDGVLDFDEFETLWDSIEYPKHKKKPPAKDMFDVVHADMSGDIQFDEFVAFTFDPRQIDPETREQYLRSAFSGIATMGDDCADESFVDSGENGRRRKKTSTTFITERIRPAALKALFSDEVQSLVDILFEEIDTDKDGAISYEEFSKHILHLCEP